MKRAALVIMSLVLLIGLAAWTAPAAQAEEWCLSITITGATIGGFDVKIGVAKAGTGNYLLTGEADISDPDSHIDAVFVVSGAAKAINNILEMTLTGTELISEDSEELGIITMHLLLDPTTLSGVGRMMVNHENYTDWYREVTAERVTCPSPGIN